MATKPRREINPARVAECAKRATSRSIQRVESPTGREEDPSLGPAVGPIDDAAIRVRLALAIRKGIEAPQQRAVIGSERDHRQPGSGPVQDAINNYRSCLDVAVGR